MGLPVPSLSGESQTPSPWLYRELIRSTDETKAAPGTFAVCLTRLEQQFFDKFPRKVKDLILLLKRWYQQVICRSPVASLS